MRTLALTASLLLSIFAAAEERAQSQSRSLLDALYSLVWPDGRFNGDLLNVVSKSTQKGTSSHGGARLYLVDAGTGTATAWPSTDSAADPVFCPSDRTLYYRRGDAIAADALEVADTGVKRSGGAIRLSGPPLRSLVACAALHGRSVLWIQTVEGHLVRVSRRGATLVDERGDDSPDLAGVAQETLAERLRVLRAIRPDGFAVSVLNGALVADRPGRERYLLVKSSSIEFFGIPTWVQGTDVLFVTGAREASP
jgi:hypothetical protein